MCPRNRNTEHHHNFFFFLEFRSLKHKIIGRSINSPERLVASYSRGGLISIAGLVFLLGHVLALWPFSRHNRHVYFLLPETIKSLNVSLPPNFIPTTWGQDLRLWPPWRHILQRWCHVTLPLWLLILDFGQVLLLCPFFPQSRHLNRLSTKLSLSSGQ